MIYDLDLRTYLQDVRTNEPAKYLSQKLFPSTVVVRTKAHTHNGPIALPEPLVFGKIVLIKGVKRKEV